MSERFGLAGLAVRMTVRAPLKLFSMGFLLALVSFLLAGVVLVRSGVEEATARGAKRLGADLMVVPQGAEVPLGAGLFGGVPVRFSLPEGIDRRIAVMPGVLVAAPQYFLSSAPASCCETGNLLLVGFDPSRDVTVLPWLSPHVRLKMETGSILVGGSVMKGTGAALRFYNHPFTVAARLEKTGMGYFDNAVFIPLDGVSAMERSSGSAGGVSLRVPWGRPSILLVRLAPSIVPRDMASLLERRYPGIKVLTIPGLFRENRLRMEKLARGQLPLAAAAWLFAVLGGGALQFLYWRERRSSLGLLQAFGCGKGVLMLLFGAEAFVLSLAGMVAGSAGAFFVLRLFASYFAVTAGMPLLLGGLDLSLSGLPWLWLVFAGTMAVEAVIIMFLMLRREPADLLRGA
ncbi:FtsX-like permease family protein [Geomobilimonas luticola]|uniref:ABC transporter permease n=1 Tax=Geomobilimonas luticola TaxID=1114878 RepID=A0ABS5SEM9_9BACT|nr:FtsX-like permease family protein [Geomobilimonas luticola]MBT0653830.1 ABC transporter permease [Geomobilimonas luticola]